MERFNKEKTTNWVSNRCNSLSVGGNQWILLHTDTHDWNGEGEYAVATCVSWHGFVIFAEIVVVDEQGRLAVGWWHGSVSALSGPFDESVMIQKLNFYAAKLLLIEQKVVNGYYCPQILVFLKELKVAVWEGGGSEVTVGYIRLVLKRKMIE